MSNDSPRPVHPDPAVVANLTKHFERQVERLAVHFEEQAADARLYGGRPIRAKVCGDGLPDYSARARSLEDHIRSSAGNSPIGVLLEAAADLDRYLRSAPPEAS